MGWKKLRIIAEERKRGKYGVMRGAQKKKLLGRRGNGLKIQVIYVLRVLW